MSAHGAGLCCRWLCLHHGAADDAAHAPEHHRGSSFLSSRRSARELPMHTYHAVIQQLKQQKHELLSRSRLSGAGRRLRKTSAPQCFQIYRVGCLFTGPERFGSAGQRRREKHPWICFASGNERRRNVSRGDSKFRRPGSAGNSGCHSAVDPAFPGYPQSLESDYLTPAGEQRILEITISPVYTPSGEIWARHA